MKTILTFTILLLLTTSIFSQDLIVKNDGDSINCKITKVKKDNIYFIFNHKNETRNTLLPLTGVKEYKYNFYTTSEVPKEKVVRYENYQHFRIAFNGGYSYQTAKVADGVPSDFRDYVKGLKSGYHFGSDITYYFTEQLGLGIKYNVFKTSNKLDSIYLAGDIINNTFSKLSDDLTITFIGPAFSTRIINQNKRNAFLMDLSLGYMGYSNNKVLDENYKMTGSTMGMALDFGYDIGLSKNLSLGFQVSFITGTLFKYNWNDGTTMQTIKLEKGEYESLNRIDFSVGLRFSK
ncbi:MAG: hypothetical protein ABI266_08680 [Ginsengibacter sp.]